MALDSTSLDTSRGVAPGAVPESFAGLQPAIEAEKRTTEAQTLINKYFGTTVIKPTGRLDRATQDSLERFQRAEGLQGVQAGQVDDATLRALRERAPIGYGRAQQDAVERSKKARANGVPTPALTSPLALPEHASRVKTQGTPYVVKTGDTIDSIAMDHGVTREQLLANNPGLVDPAATNTNQIIISDRTLLLLPPGARRVKPGDVPVIRDANSPTPTVDNRTHPGAWTDAPTKPARPLQRSAGSSELVRVIKERLQALGYDVGPLNGRFDARMQAAVRYFQEANNLSPSGIIDDKTWETLQAGDSQLAPINVGSMPRYEPGSAAQVKLFKAAAALLRSRGIDVPDSWAESAGLQNIIRRESNGQVGRPNYTYGARAKDASQWPAIWRELQQGKKSTKSSATGIGQLLLANVDRYYPAGRAGIGDPVQEAAGMLAYIKDRYRTPESAWAQYGKRHEGY